MSRRSRGPSANLVAVLAVASMAIHALVLAALHFSKDDLEYPPALALEPAAKTAVAPSCVADEALASAARLAFCATPFPADPDGCVADTFRDFRLAVVACRSTAANVIGGAEPVDVALLDPEVLEQLEAKPIMPLDDVPEETIEEKLAKLAEEKHEEARKAEARPAPSGQVVEINRPRLELAPDKARYVSEYDSKVDKETVARGTTAEMVDRPGPEVGQRSELVEVRDGKKSDQGEGDDGDGALSMRKPGLPVPDRDPVATAGRRDGIDAIRSEHGFEARRGDGDRVVVTEPGDEGEGGGGGDQDAVPNLRPSEEILERVVGGGSVDKLDGVENGATTALNAKRWKFASFFNRLKRQVAQNWHPDRVYVNRDPNGNVYGSKDRITVLKVSLRANGSVDNIYISKTSGVDFLDDEAVRAFRAAQPFPNPPGGLVRGDAQLITFSFGFHFQIGSRRGWKVFRSR
jgi:TonB family protein